MELSRYIVIFIVFLGSFHILASLTITLNQDSYYSLKLIIYDHSGKKALFEPPSTLPLVIIQRIGSNELREQLANYNQTITYCDFSELEAGDYRVKVLWKGIQVYRNDNISLSNNLTLTIYCNVSLASFSIVDGFGNAIKNVKIRLLHQESITLLNNVTAHEGNIKSLLPFGDYVVVAAFMNVRGSYLKTSPLKQSFIRVNSSGTYIFTIDGELQKHLILKVFPLDIELLTNERNPLSSTVFKKLRLTLSIGEEELMQFSLNQSRVYIKQLPSGTYTLKIFWEDYCFDVKSLDHYSGIKRYLEIRLNEFVEIYFVDESNVPLINANITIITPWEEKWSLVTDKQGKITLVNVPHGSYIALIKVKDYPQTKLNITITSLDYYKEKIAGFLTVTLRIIRKSIHDKSLPDGVKLKISIDGNLVNETIIKKSTITLSNVPKGLLQLCLKWQGVIVGDLEEILTSSKEIIVECEIYQMRIILKDLDGHPLKGCRVRVNHPNGTQIESITDANGIVYWRYLPRGKYNVTILWNGMIVYKEEIHLFNDFMDKIIVVKLKTFYIKVIDVLGQPVPKVEILLKPLASEKVYSEYNMSTVLRPTVSFGSSFLFKKVFLPVNTYKLIIKVRGIVVKMDIVKLGKGIDKIIVKCPVLTLPLEYVITKYDVPLLVILTIIVILTIVISIRYWRLLQLKRIFVEEVPQKREKLTLTKAILAPSTKQAMSNKSELALKLKVKDRKRVQSFLKPPVRKESYGELEEYEEEYEEYEVYEELFE